MRIAYVTSWLSSAGGGVSAAVEALSRSINVSLAQVHVLGLDDRPWSNEKQKWRGAPVEAFHIIGPGSLGFAPGLRRALIGLDPDVVHVHGLWMHLSADVVAWSRGAKPYIVSPHGMLDPWAVANSGFKKRVARWLYEDRHLGGAACIHALCAAEADAIRAFGLKNPICIIPNGIEMPRASHRPAPPWSSIEDGARVLLFLGRLHPKKNVHGLLRALARVKADRGLGDWRLAIAGWDQGGYGAELVVLAEALALKREVIFLGALHGERKDAALRNADAFVLPSVSEGLPMTVLEAWSYGLPVAMTAACNLPEGFAAGAARQIATEPDLLARHLTDFLSTSPRDMNTMGVRGAELARARFSWERASQSFTETYAWMHGGGRMPGCVMQPASSRTFASQARSLTADERR
jgi:poly(glycerol-phosphate) alpha-glucosyltransferase